MYELMQIPEVLRVPRGFAYCSPLLGEGLGVRLFIAPDVPTIVFIREGIAAVNFRIFVNRKAFGQHLSCLGLFYLD